MAARSKKVTSSQRRFGLRASRAIAEAEALFLSIGEGAIVTDAEGKISRINEVALDILGIRAEDILGKWYPDAVVAENEAGEVLLPIERPITEMFITGKPVFRKLYFRTAGGGRVAVALTVSPVLLSGQPVGAIELFRDITEEVQLDKAKNEFIYLASHQLRTPATGVKQYIELLIDGYAGKVTPAQQKFLAIADESNNRQLRIIDDLLKVAAADSGELVLRKDKHDVVQMLQEVIAEQSSLFEHHDQQIMLTYNRPSVYAHIDKNTMRMVFENLLNNAHKYSYPKQKITVSVMRLPRFVEVVVEDEGVGIDEADIKKLFQKFSRVNNPLSVSSGGTGLGLYWAKKVIDLHGGSIEVKSQLNKGTSFSIKLEHA